MKSWNPTGTLGTGISVDLDPNGAAIWCSMDPINKNPSHVRIFFHHGSLMGYDRVKWGDTQHSNAVSEGENSYWNYRTMMILHIDSPLDLGFGLFSDQTIPILVGMCQFFDMAISTPGWLHFHGKVMKNVEFCWVSYGFNGNIIRKKPAIDGYSIENGIYI